MNEKCGNDSLVMFKNLTLQYLTCSVALGGVKGFIVFSRVVPIAYHCLRLHRPSPPGEGVIL